MKMRHVFSPRRRRSSSEGLSRLGAPGLRQRKLRLEPLESRLLLATNYLVNSLADTVAADGFVTLREAIQAANTDVQVHEAPAGSGHDVIEFDSDLTGGTIAINAALGQLQITGNLNLLGQGVTIDAAGNCRVVSVAASVDRRDDQQPDNHERLGHRWRRDLQRGHAFGGQLDVLGQCGRQVRWSDL